MVLSDTMIHLHSEFTKQHPDVSLSYSSFCSLRPFYVAAHKPSDRKTCQCQFYENAKMMIEASKEYGITESGKLDESFELVYCSLPSEACLSCVCTRCFHKSISISAQQHLINVRGQQWEWVRDQVEAESHHNTKLVTHILAELIWRYEDLLHNETTTHVCFIRNYSVQRDDRQL